MSTSPDPSGAQTHRISDWIKQTYRKPAADAFSPPTPPLSRTSSLASSEVLPSHSTSVRDSGRTRAPNQPTAAYLSPIPFLPVGQGFMPSIVAMHVDRTPSSHRRSAKHSSYPTTSSYPKSAHTHTSYHPTISDTRATSGTALPPNHLPTSAHARSRSVPRTLPITIPQDYAPVSPRSGGTSRSHRSETHHGHHRGRSLSRSHPHSSTNDPAVRRSNVTRMHYGFTVPTSHHTTSHHTSWYDPHGRHRSVSDLPVTTAPRPTYHRRRSRSYDPPPVSAPSHHSRHHYNDYRHGYPSGGTMALSQGSSGLGSAYHMVQASPTSPTLVHPSKTQPVVVPLNDGRNGWVVVPGDGQKLRVMDRSEFNSKIVQRKEKGEGQSFFGRLLGGKNKDPKHSKGSHERVESKPVATLVKPSHHHRRRRDSY